MEFFMKAKKVRLSNCHGKFLVADDDKRRVYQSKNGNCTNAIWHVKRITVDGHAKLRLRSCFNCYLTGSPHPFLLGMTGNKVFQTNPTMSDDLCDWLPQDFGSLVTLSTRTGSLLRSNSGAPPWRNSVTHDHPLVAGTVDVYWAVEVVEEEDEL